jgi:type IV pilus assembly protein PilE
VHIHNKFRRFGFTLLEILIVLVTLSVLSGLAIPIYGNNMEKMRSVEAIQHLNATKDSLGRYFADNGTFVGATIPVLGGGTLDFNPNITEGGQTKIFTYDFSAGPTANTFTIRATRTFIPFCGGAAVTGNITMNELGAIARTGAYA